MHHVDYRDSNPWIVCMYVAYQIFWLRSICTYTRTFAQGQHALRENYRPYYGTRVATTTKQLLFPFLSRDVEPISLTLCEKMVCLNYELNSWRLRRENCIMIKLLWVGVEMKDDRSIDRLGEHRKCAIGTPARPIFVRFGELAFGEWQGMRITWKAIHHSGIPFNLSSSSSCRLCMWILCMGNLGVVSSWLWFWKADERPTRSPSLESNSVGICFLTHLVLACFFTFFVPNKIIVGRRASGPNAPNPKGLHQDLSEASCQLWSMQGTHQGKAWSDLWNLVLRTSSLRGQVCSSQNLCCYQGIRSYRHTKAGFLI